MLHKYVVSLALLAFGGFGFFAWWSGEQDWKRMERELAAARQSLAALPSERSVLRGKAIEGDARAAYRAAFDMLTKLLPSEGDSAQKYPGAYDHASLREATRGALHRDQSALLRELAPFLALLDHALRCKSASPRAWSEGATAESTKLSDVRQVQIARKLLGWQLQQSVAAAEPRAACDRLLDALRLSSDIAAEGSYLHHILAAHSYHAIASLAFDAEDAAGDDGERARPPLVDFATWPASERRRLDDALAEQDSTALSLEELGLFETLDFHVKSGRGAPYRNSLIPKPSYLFSGTALYADAILARLEQARDSAKIVGDFSARTKALQELDAGAHSAATEADNPITLAAAMPISAALLQASAERLFALRALRIAIARAQGTEVSLGDPFGGEGTKLTVAKFGRGFEVRSVGSRLGRPLRLARQ